MPAPAARTIAATETLIEAGCTLATLADPTRDLHDIGGDFAELAETLRLIGGGLRHAQERADDIRDSRLDNLATGKLWHADGRDWTRDEVELAHRNEIAAARRTAARTAQRAMVELARVIREMESRSVPDPRDPRSDAELRNRDPIFRDHNCSRCRDGEKACVKGDPRRCDWPHARND